MNRWELEIILRNIEEERGRPKLDDSAAWIGAFLAFLLPLLASDFRDFLSIPASAWTAFVLCGTLFCGYKVLAVWFDVYNHRNDAHPKAADIVQKLVDEFKAEKQPVGQVMQAPVQKLELQGQVAPQGDLTLEKITGD